MIFLNRFSTVLVAVGFSMVSMMSIGTRRAVAQGDTAGAFDLAPYVHVFAGFESRASTDGVGLGSLDIGSLGGVLVGAAGGFHAREQAFIEGELSYVFAGDMTISTRTPDATSSTDVSGPGVFTATGTVILRRSRGSGRGPFAAVGGGFSRVGGVDGSLMVGDSLVSFDTEARFHPLISLGAGIDFPSSGRQYRLDGRLLLVFPQDRGTQLGGRVSFGAVFGGS